MKAAHRPRRAPSTPLLLLSLLLPQTIVAFSWNQAPPFPVPDRIDNVCSTQQASGWTFDHLDEGPIQSFDSMSLSGLSCQSHGAGNTGRSLPRALGTRSKSSSNKVLSGHATLDDASCPRISSTNQAFSVQSFRISTDTNAWVTFKYTMPDGSVCRQSAWCTAEEQDVVNTQCGGALDVKILGNCQVNLHQVSFACDHHDITSSLSMSVPSTTSSSLATTTSDKSTSSYVVTSSSGTTVPTTSTSHSWTTSVPETSTPATLSTLGTTSDVHTSAATTQPPSSSVATTSSSLLTTCSAHSDLVWSSWAYFNQSQTSATSYTQTSTLSATSSSIQDILSSALPVPNIESSNDQYSIVLPRCLTTWAEQHAGCSSNSDTECFCPSALTITAVQDCVSAWSTSNDQTQVAYTLLAGICIDHFAQNPGLCTDLTSSDVAATASMEPTGGSWGYPPGSKTTPATPALTTAPTTTAICIHGATSSVTSMATVTVPQVVFSTVTVSDSVGGSAITIVNLIPTSSASGSGALISSIVSATQSVPTSGAISSASRSVEATSKSSRTSASGSLQTYTGGGHRDAHAVGSGLLLLVALLA